VDGGSARWRRPTGSEGAWPCGNCGAATARAGNDDDDDERLERCEQCGAARPPPAAAAAATAAAATAAAEAEGAPAVNRPPPPAPLAVRILLCAPSEAAANVLCLRLAALGVAPAAMRRLAWWQVGLESLPPQLLRFTAEGHGGVLVPDCLPTDSYEVVKLVQYENRHSACARAAFEGFPGQAC
jgi:hypothetical protein